MKHTFLSSVIVLSAVLLTNAAHAQDSSLGIQWGSSLKSIKDPINYPEADKEFGVFNKDLTLNCYSSGIIQEDETNIPNTYCFSHDKFVVSVVGIPNEILYIASLPLDTLNVHEQDDKSERMGIWLSQDNPDMAKFAYYNRAAGRGFLMTRNMHVASEIIAKYPPKEVKK